jgi:hypothetical protein
VIRFIHVNDLHIDKTYQRDPSNGNLEKIGGDTFNPHALGVLKVCRRKKNKLYYVVDGQHRLVVVQQMLQDGDDVSPYLLCEVLEGTTREEEADLFVLLNTNKPVTGNIRFRARLVCKYNPESRIKDIVQDYGFELMFLKPGNPRGIVNQNPKGLRGEGVMLKAYEAYGEDIFTLAVRILKDCYGKQHAARQGMFIYGLCYFISSQAVNERSLNQVYKRLKGTLAETGIQLAENEAKYSTGKYRRIGLWLADICGLRRAEAA